MGGLGSGRQFGRPIVEASLVIDLAWMLRTGRARSGAITTGCLTWTSRGQPLFPVDYTALMAMPGAERLELSYGGERCDKPCACTIRCRITAESDGG